MYKNIKCETKNKIAFITIDRPAALNALNNEVLEELLAVFRNAAADGDVSFDAVDYRPPVAICVGGEGKGLPEHILQQASMRVSIPMAGGVESLNVAVAAGILLYRAFGGRPVAGP